MRAFVSVGIGTVFAVALGLTAPLTAQTVTFGDGEIGGEVGAEPAAPESAAVAPAADAPDPAAELDAMAAATVRLGLSAYAQLRSGKGGVALSPVALASLLTSSAALCDERAARELHKALDLDLPPDRRGPALRALLGALSSPDASERFASACGLWASTGQLSPGAPERCVELGAECATLPAGDPMTARQTLSTWARERSGEQLWELLPTPALFGAPPAVAGTVTAFEGAWARPFKRKDTKPGSFRTLDGQKVRVPLMHHLETHGYARLDGFRALELHYLSGDVSMLILLPDKPRGLAKLERSLSPERLEEWVSALRVTEVRLTLPRFKLRGHVDAPDLLGRLGARRVLRAGGGLSGLTTAEDGRLAAGALRMRLDVNETGAGKAGAKRRKTDRSPLPPRDFVATHPFLVLVRHAPTGALLFIGRVANPQP